MSSTRRAEILSTPALLALAFAGLVSIAPSAHSRRAEHQDGPDPKVAVTIALQVGGQRYDFTGQAVCLLTPNGSIYDAPTAMYSVRHTSDRQHLNMTLFRLKSGSDMLNLDVTLGAGSHRVSTLKVGANGTAAGSGTVRLTTAGKGGTLNIDATDAKGVKISGTVKCESFNKPVEDNGN